MSKKNFKHKKYTIYRKYGFDRTMANAWNNMSYETWLIADEGRERPDPQRLTNFLCKYGRKSKITGRSILSYIPEDYKKLMLEWVSMTKGERKIVRQYSPDAGKKITGWLHQAEIMYLNDIERYE
jgi:hypothetical protein